MLFNSFEFILFLPIVFFLYWFIFNKDLKWQNAFLLLASYFFYGWWSVAFLGLLMLSTLLDFLYGFGVASSNKKRSKFFLWLSVINNLGILAVFKYYNFFLDQFQAGFAHLGMHFSASHLAILLPVGISFYTFHGMSYVFDIYRGQRKPVKNIIEYSLFVSFFPLLVAGPIERANHLLPQIQVKKKFNYQQAVSGCRLILWGMFKKVIIADGLAAIADPIFSNYPAFSTYSLVLGAIAYSFQIYGDFSGYSDIALGTAKLFGFELLSNFKFPYFSRDIAEFWRRWHISLSSWFRDYLYIPLGGSKNGKPKAVRNTFIIFLVSGFWHGASWNFITWGFIHACGFLPLLLLNRNRRNVTTVVAEGKLFPSIRETGQMIYTFGFVTFAWVFFRMHNVADGAGYIKRIISGIVQHPADVFSGTAGQAAIIYILPLLAIDWQIRSNEREIFVFRNKWVRHILYFALLLILLVIGFNKTKSFIYFVF